MSESSQGPLTTLVGLPEQREALSAQIDEAVAHVMAHGQFVMGPEVTQLEQRLADFCGARHCITCANGTDALKLLLMAEGIGPGDAVFVPAFTFVATAGVVALVGAVPIFLDVDRESFNLDPSSLQDAIALAKRLGLRPRCVIAVDLF